MTDELPDTFTIAVYDSSEIAALGYTIDDCYPKILKGTQYWVLKKDVAAELEWSRKKSGLTVGDKEAL